MGSITYNDTDVHIPAIKKINAEFVVKLAGRNNDQAKYSYYVYGLVNAPERPPVLISQDNEGRPNVEKLRRLGGWLEANGVQMLKGDGADGTGDEDEIYIGIRRDVRRRPKFAAALIRTMIAYLEGRTALASFEIPQVKGIKWPMRRSRRS